MTSGGAPDHRREAPTGAGTGAVHHSDRQHARRDDSCETRSVLLPDTALHTAAHIPALEKELGKPVLTANQVTVWEALRLADRRVNAPELGALFTREPIVQV
ncbi:hypothetical protein GCM10010254_38270 [Streptomyces chromofuscus]|nr:hypothetical protein GCM10010254_38270 [Streptomyces chromofuscus]